MRKQDYIIAQSLLGLVGPLIVAAGMAVAGRAAIKEAKAVRTIFPFIKKHGNNTVMFGFIVTKVYIYILFVVMLFIVALTMSIFFTYVAIQRTNTYNPFDNSTDCFHEDGAPVEWTIDQAVMLDENIECFTWGPNVAGAIGQATAILLFSWTFISVMTWIILNCHSFLEKKCKIPQIRKYVILVFLQLVISVIPVGLCVATVVLYSDWSLPLVSFVELICLSGMLLIPVFWCLVKKEPKNLEDSIGAKIKSRIDPDEEDQDRTLMADEIIDNAKITGLHKSTIEAIILEMAELEWKRALVSKVAEHFDIDDITTRAYNNIKTKITASPEPQAQNAIQPPNPPTQGNMPTTCPSDTINEQNETNSGQPPLSNAPITTSSLTYNISSGDTPGCIKCTPV